MEYIEFVFNWIVSNLTLIVGVIVLLNLICYITYYKTYYHSKADLKIKNIFNKI